MMAKGMLYKNIAILLIMITAIAVPLSSNAQEAEKPRDVCSHVKNQPQSANYISGIDVNGNQVISADLNSTSFINDPIIIPIDLNIAQLYGISLPDGIELKPEIKNIKIFSNGIIIYNDEDISEAIHALCNSAPDQSKKNQSDQEEERRHESPYPVLSSDKIEGQFPDNVN